MSFIAQENFSVLSTIYSMKWAVNAKRNVSFVKATVSENLI